MSATPRLAAHQNGPDAAPAPPRHSPAAAGAAGLVRATKGLALLSLAAAIALESWLARPLWAYLPHATAAAAAIGLLAGRLAPLPTSAAILLLTYVGPVIAFVAIGRFGVELLLVWSAALTGLLLADAHRWRWAYPGPWQLPLVLWALTVAVAWPITALREADFTSLELLQRYNIPNTGIGGSPRVVIAWGLDTAVIHLLGLLWFNWLFARARELDGPGLRRWVVWPLAVSAVLGSLLTIYQGVVDLTFLSVGAWATLERAAGPLLDANASGMMAALWATGLLALAVRVRWSRPIAILGCVTCWVSMWLTGSRTALATALISLAWAGMAAVRGTRIRRRSAVAGVAAIAAMIGLLATLSPSTSASPLDRLRKTLPSELSTSAFSEFVRELWNRNGYGAVATTLIAERPLAGVGIGLFNLEGSAHAPDPRRLPPDNAQNWWRHHVAELGFAGAAGLLLWTIVFVAFLWRTRGEARLDVPAASLAGALVGLGLTSFVGMPAQSLALAMTFWAFAFWYVGLVRPSAGPADRGLATWAWLLVIVWVVAYAGLLIVMARGADRPAMRAAAGGWRYTYGIYDPTTPAIEGTTVRWTEREGVAVVPNDSPWMILTIRAQHPDLRERPVRTRVIVNGRVVVETTLHADAPITRAINTGAAPRAIVETRVDRTWRPADAPPRHPEVGLALSWRFAPERPAGMPSVTAPLHR